MKTTFREKLNNFFGIIVAIILLIGIFILYAYAKNAEFEIQKEFRDNIDRSIEVNDSLKKLEQIKEIKI